ncbi:carotenoid oxygenase family protein [Candidatus Entotheonella palauensis]
MKSTHDTVWKSESLILDAGAISQGPIARVTLPQRLPAGFYGRFSALKG